MCRKWRKARRWCPLCPRALARPAFTADETREWQDWHEYSQRDYNRYEYELDEDEEVGALHVSGSSVQGVRGSIACTAQSSTASVKVGCSAAGPAC